MSTAGNDNVTNQRADALSLVNERFADDATMDAAYHILNTTSRSRDEWDETVEAVWYARKLHDLCPYIREEFSNLCPYPDLVEHALVDKPNPPPVTLDMLVEEDKARRKEKRKHSKKKNVT